MAMLGPYMIINIYAPSGSEKKYERAEFFGQDVFRALRLNPDSLWVIGGDFNCVLKSIDIEGGVGFSQKICHQLKNLVKSFDLHDVYRYKFAKKEEFTFFRSGKAPSRLDRFYVSARLLSGLGDVLHVASLSDHCGVQMGVELMVELMSLPKTQRRTYWKLNTAILEEEDFLPNFTSFWGRFQA